MSVKFGIDETVKGKFFDTFLDAWYAIAPTRTIALPEVCTTLQELSKYFTLALVTARDMSSETIAQELKRLKLDHLFDLIVTSRDVEERKPSPQCFTYAARFLGVPVTDCVVVGDSINDIHAGKSAGAKTIAIVSGLFSKEELEVAEPDLIFENISILLQHFGIK